MKKLFSGIIFGMGAAFLAGCSQTALSNLTPERLPQNPSGIYTFSMSTNVDRQHLVPESMKASMVINGEEVPMSAASTSGKLFDADFRMPAGQTEVRYFYKLAYRTNEMDFLRDHDCSSPVYTTFLVNRYVLSLESDRGPVGATIAVMGRGFSQYDTVMIGSAEAQTRYFSPNSLQFTVPAVEAGRSYDVHLRTGNGDMLIGSFTVDPSKLAVLPEKLDLTEGGKTMLVFAVDNEAPEGGLPVAIKTDIPASVIMPEVVIPEGERSVSVTVEGGPAAEGKLVASAPGYLPVTLPVSVK
jgi:hypothetical protein